MKLSEFSIKRPVTIFMAIIAVIIFGIVSYSRLNLDMLPNINVPMIMVNTQYQGAGPNDIEENLTKPLEAVIGTVSNVKEIKSISSEGSSVIMIQFEDKTDMNFAGLELREKIDMIKGMLPKDIMEPMIMKMDPSMMPISVFGISFKEGNEKIGEYSESVLKGAIESVEGVASVQISGANTKGIKIEIDNDKLLSYGINTQSLIAAIKSEDINYPIGTIVEGDYEVLVRTFSNIDSLKSFEDINLKTSEGKIIKLKDVSKILFEDKKDSSFSKINGNDALIVNVQKESTANTVEVNKNINKKLKELKDKNENLEVTGIMDQGQVIEFMIDAVKRNAIIGGVLAVIVLLLFLKDIRTTIIMGISIPISIVWTFVMVYFGGLTLNMISLGGIALGVGMLVDNSIVVIESIYRYKKMGYGNKEAALTGTKEVSTAIMASTLTSICVFLPIVFVQGMAADIFKEMALTVTFSLVSSLIVSFTLVPVLASKLLKNDSLNKENKTLEKLKSVYIRGLNYSLNNRKGILAIVVLICVIGAFSLTAIGIEFFPSTDQGIININLITPEGSKKEVVLESALEVGEKIKEIEEVETIAFMGDKDKTSMYAILKKDRGKSDKEVLRDIRKKTDLIPGVKAEISAGSMGATTGSPISISIRGEDFNELDEISDVVLEKMNGIKGIENISSTNKSKTDEIRININKEKAAKYGLNALTIAQSIGSYFKDITISDIRLNGEGYKVYLSPNSNKNPDLEALKSATITTMTGSKIPLMSICEIQRGKGYSKIYRQKSLREVGISADLDGKALNKAVEEIQDSLKDYQLKAGYEIIYGGEFEQMQDAFSQLLLALVLAVILVYMVMAAQFESLINPFIIMFTVPVAFISALLTLFFTNVTISIPAMIGFVMLTGIIVNNGIVLIDFINKERDKGKAVKEAIINAGNIRLQPILMTALTTIMGLLPMALGIGEGNEIQLPLAMTVIGGLTFGTFITLFLIPVIYSLFDDLKNKAKNKKVKMELNEKIKVKK